MFDSEALSASSALTCSKAELIHPDMSPDDNDDNDDKGTCYIQMLTLDLICTMVMTASAASINPASNHDSFILLTRRALPLRAVSSTFKLAIDTAIDSERIQVYQRQICNHFQAGERRVQKLVERCMMICFMPSLGVILKDSERARLHKKEWDYLAANFPRRLINRLKKHKQLQTQRGQQPCNDMHHMFVNMVGEPLCNAVSHALTQAAYNRVDQVELLKWASDNRLFETSHKRKLLYVTRRHVWLQELVAEALKVQLGTLPAVFLPTRTEDDTAASSIASPSSRQRPRRALPISFGISPVIRSRAETQDTEQEYEGPTDDFQI